MVVQGAIRDAIWRKKASEFVVHKRRMISLEAIQRRKKQKQR